MKCSKCNNDMTIRYDLQTGQQTATCGYCNSSINILSPNVKKQSSTLSIVAFIFSFLCCLSFVGLILGIIDLIRNDKRQNHGLSIAAIIISVLWILLFGLFSLIETEDPSPTDTQVAGSELIIQESEVSESELIIESEVFSESEFIETESSSIDIPEVETQVIETEKPSTENTSSETNETATSDREEFISQCQPADYKTLARYSVEHIGDKVILTVKISQVVQGGWFDSSEYYRVYTDNDGYGWYLDDEYFMYDMRVDDDTRLLEDDIIIIYGEFAGLEKVTRAFSGTEEYIPAINAYYIDIIE